MNTYAAADAVLGSHVECHWILCLGYMNVWWPPLVIFRVSVYRLWFCQFCFPASSNDFSIVSPPTPWLKTYAPSCCGTNQILLALLGHPKNPPPQQKALACPTPGAHPCTQSSPSQPCVEVGKGGASHPGPLPAKYARREEAIHSHLH